MSLRIIYHGQEELLDEDDFFLLQKLRRLYPENSKVASWNLELCSDSGQPIVQDNTVRLPFKFYRSLSENLPPNFDEHARQKLLYNELSQDYMTAIAGDTEKETRFLEGLLGPRRKKILDLCCGVGRHATLMADKGFPVTGVDFSAAQIETAQKRNASPLVKFVQMDVRKLDLPEKDFDLAACMWTTYNYFSEEKDFTDFITAVAHHQPKGALLVLDAKNIPALSPRRLYRRSCQHGTDKLELLIHKRIRGNIQNSQYLYFFSGSRLAFYLDEEFVRFYYVDELAALSRNWYDIVKVYGDFDMSPYEPQSSRRFIVVLLRK